MSSGSTAAHRQGDLHIVLCTCPDEASAGRLARSLVERRLAACVNVLPGLRSVYRWQGAIEEQAECLLLIKSPPALWQRLTAAIREAHPYETPEIVALDAAAVDRDYLVWLSAATDGHGTE